MLDRHVIDVVHGRFLVTIHVIAGVVAVVREELVHGKKGKRTKEKRKKKGKCKIAFTRRSWFKAHPCHSSSLHTGAPPNQRRAALLFWILFGGFWHYTLHY